MKDRAPSDVERGREPISADRRDAVDEHVNVVDKAQIDRYHTLTHGNRSKQRDDPPLQSEDGDMFLHAEDDMDF